MKNEFLEAVKQNYKALKDVPPAFITAELCMEAVKENGYAIRYVPEEFKTDEFR